MIITRGVDAISLSKFQLAEPDGVTVISGVVEITF
jgi:hypothetical protein